MNANDIRDKLATDERWLARGILAIAARQTADEQSGKVTRYLNGCGFNRNDASFGCSLADWLKAGKALTPRQAEAARRMMVKYAGQLARIAENKQPVPYLVVIKSPTGQCGEFLLVSHDDRPVVGLVREKLNEVFETQDWA